MIKYFQVKTWIKAEVNFLSFKMTKHALMIGLNYEDTKMALNGCINDIHSMRDMITKKLGFQANNIVVMHDKLSHTSSLYPNKDNICVELKKMVNKCGKGDLLFLHYSGHGVKGIKSEECLYPSGASASKPQNYVCEDEISKIVSKMHKEANMFILSDSCNTKSIVDFTYVVTNVPGQKDQYNLKKREGQKYEDGAEMVCLTATSGDQKAYDVIDTDGKAYGILTHVFCKMVNKALEKRQPLSYLDVLSEITESTKSYKQTPMLSFSKRACLTCYLSLMIK
jgi:hypothetical protein